ncbi:hypothetical protein CPB85DRAFT_1416301 [Mucidula mucida]|nr:hypothetical protein CPB85DRAFT_1416301 [Mucidula mucida]
MIHDGSDNRSCSTRKHMVPVSGFVPFCASRQEDEEDESDYEMGDDRAPPPVDNPHNSYSTPNNIQARAVERSPPVALQSPWNTIPRVNYAPSIVSTPSQVHPTRYHPAPQPYPYNHMPQLPVLVYTPNSSAPPSQLSAMSDPLREMELRFSDGLFRGVFPQKYQPPAARASQTDFRWDAYGDVVTDDDRAQILINCMWRVGFRTLGHALSVLFRHDTFDNHQSVATTVSNFLGQKSRFKEEHPDYIIYELIYPHSHSTTQNPPPLVFDLPQYGLPPSQRLEPTLPPRVVHTTTRGAMLNQSVQLVLEEIDREAKVLAKDESLLRRLGTSLTWDTLLSWDMPAVQEQLAKQAPVLFASMATVGVGGAIHKKFRLMDGAVPDNEVPDSSNGNSTDPGDDADVSRPEASDSPPLDSHSTGVPPHTRRDPWLAITIFILSLLHLRYCLANLFPTIVGIYLFLCNVPRDILLFTSRLGISLGDHGVRSALHTLANDASNKLRSMGKRTETKPPMFQIVFDNVNKMRRAWQQTLGTCDDVQSGTAATIVMLRNVSPETLDPERLKKKMSEGGRKNLTLEVLEKDIKWDHIEGIGAATILRVWIKHIPALGRFRNEVEELFTSKYAICRLSHKKSEIYTMKTTGINESTYSGVKDVLYNLLVTQLRVLQSWAMQWIWFIGGDQLSIDRMRHLKSLLRKTLPIIQLWHLKWNWQKAIFCLHWWQHSGKGIFGLHFDTNILGRDKFNPDCGDFYPSHAILKD